MLLLCNLIWYFYEHLQSMHFLLFLLLAQLLLCIFSDTLSTILQIPKMWSSFNKLEIKKFNKRENVVRYRRRANRNSLLPLKCKKQLGHPARHPLQTLNRTEITVYVITYRTRQSTQPQQRGKFSLDSLDQ